MLFANFSDESIEDFKLKFRDVAVKYIGNKLGFLLGDSGSDNRKTIIQVICKKHLASTSINFFAIGYFVDNFIFVFLC